MPYPTTTDFVFTEGLDPTAVFTTPEATALLSFLRLATPNAYRGNVINATSTPATTGQPTGYPTDWYSWQKRCLWYEPTSGTLFGYVTGLGWTAVTVVDGSITTAKLADGSVTVAKIAPGTSLQLFRTNVGGTAVESVALSAILTAGVVPIASISPTGAGALNGFMRSNGTTNYWGALSAYDINVALAIGSFAIDKLTIGTARQILRTNAAASSTEYVAPTSIFDDGELPITKLSPATGNANKMVAVNSAGTALEFRAAPSVPTIAKYVSGSLTVPAAAAVTTATHGMASTPEFWSASFACTTINQGYAVGDVVDHKAVSGENAGTQYQAYTATVSATTFSLVGVAGFATINIPHKTTGVVGTFTPASWALIYRGQITS